MSRAPLLATFGLALALALPAAAKDPAAAPDLAAGEPAWDSAPPARLPDGPAGAYGFSRYVFADFDGDVITTLVEGPRGPQVRCQREDLPCSYLDLKALHGSGAEVPSSLRMTRDELGTLVAQLDTLAATLARYDHIDAACADGYAPTSEQNSNMGIHMANQGLIDDHFDPARPEILLFAKEGGERLTREELGGCEGGAWTGAPGFEIVGAAFMQALTGPGEDHPEGFAGPLDNWHVHYNSCDGLPEDNILPAEACRARGGTPVERSPWMIHAYAQPGFDNQAGVFSMWNPTIWPLMDAERIAAHRRQRPDDLLPGAAHASIINFAFEEVAVAAGKPVTITNADGVPHTVTAGRVGAPSGAFDSGALATGQSFTTRFEEPGEYAFFCRVHPEMTGRVVVTPPAASARPSSVAAPDRGP